jgi:hypothetical protein
VERNVEEIAVRDDANGLDAFEVRPYAVQQRAAERLQEVQRRGPFRMDRIDVPG